MDFYGTLLKLLMTGIILIFSFFSTTNLWNHHQNWMFRFLISEHSFQRTCVANWPTHPQTLNKLVALHLVMEIRAKFSLKSWHIYCLKHWIKWTPKEKSPSDWVARLPMIPKWEMLDSVQPLSPRLTRYLNVYLSCQTHEWRRMSARFIILKINLEIQQ